MTPTFKQINFNQNRVSAITWFSGGGLAAYGLQEAGFEVLAGVEGDPDRPELSAQIADWYEKNLPSSKLYRMSVQELVASGTLYTMPQCDFFQVSPSCKQFSVANVGAKELQTDIDCAIAICKGIAHYQPKVFLLENVRAYCNSKSWTTIETELKKLKYSFREQVIDTADFGTPQNRDRFIAIASREFVPPTLIPTTNHHNSWWNSIEDLELPVSHLSELQKQYLPESDKVLIQKTGIWNNKPLVRTERQPAWTIKCANFTDGDGANRKHAINAVIDGKIKALNSRAIARLMGCPDSYQVPEAIGLAGTILGNGFPVDAIKAIALHLKPYLISGDKLMPNYEDLRKERGGYKALVPYVLAIKETRQNPYDLPNWKIWRTIYEDDHIVAVIDEEGNQDKLFRQSIYCLPSEESVEEVKAALFSLQRSLQELKTEVDKPRFSTLLSKFSLLTEEEIPKWFVACPDPNIFANYPGHLPPHISVDEIHELDGEKVYVIKQSKPYHASEGIACYAEEEFEVIDNLSYAADTRAAVLTKLLEDLGTYSVALISEQYGKGEVQIQREIDELKEKFQPLNEQLKRKKNEFSQAKGKAKNELEREIKSIEYQIAALRAEKKELVGMIEAIVSTPENTPTPEQEVKAIAPPAPTDIESRKATIQELCRQEARRRIEWELAIGSDLNTLHNSLEQFDFIEWVNTWGANEPIPQALAIQSLAATQSFEKLDEEKQEEVKEIGNAAQQIMAAGCKAVKNAISTVKKRVKQSIQQLEIGDSVRVTPENGPHKKAFGKVVAAENGRYKVRLEEADFEGEELEVTRFELEKARKPTPRKKPEKVSLTQEEIESIKEQGRLAAIAELNDQAVQLAAEAREQAEEGIQAQYAEAKDAIAAAQKQMQEFIQQHKEALDEVPVLRQKVNSLESELEKKENLIAEIQAKQWDATHVIRANQSIEEKETQKIIDKITSVFGVLSRVLSQPSVKKDLNLDKWNPDGTYQGLSGMDALSQYLETIPLEVV